MVGTKANSTVWEDHYASMLESAFGFAWGHKIPVVSVIADAEWLVFGFWACGRPVGIPITGQLARCTASRCSAPSLSEPLRGTIEHPGSHTETLATLVESLCPNL